MGDERGGGGGGCGDSGNMITEWGGLVCNAGFLRLLPYIHWRLNWNFVSYGKVSRLSAVSASRLPLENLSSYLLERVSDLKGVIGPQTNHKFSIDCYSTKLESLSVPIASVMYARTILKLLLSLSIPT